MDATIDLAEVLKQHNAWLEDPNTGKLANLSEADLSGANLSWANLSRAILSGITLCGAIIDGAEVDDNDIGGPGHILCALTDAEWQVVSESRTGVDASRETVDQQS